MREVILELADSLGVHVIEFDSNGSSSVAQFLNNGSEVVVPLPVGVDDVVLLRVMGRVMITSMFFHSIRMKVFACI